jgi:hypothetical protein
LYQYLIFKPRSLKSWVYLTTVSMW